LPIPDSFLDELVSRIDITELVGGYVRLTKKSGANMFGLCPFHSEKTPSFSVNSEKQIYHCFGCGKGGGAVSFVREIENLPFRDAIELLARQAGMTVPEESGRTEIAVRRKRLIELNRDAARHFHTMLSSPLGGSARDYLAERGISRASVTRFGLGAAPDGWSHLLDAMTKKGYTKQELIDAGLCRHGRSGEHAYDFFRDRLMFPVIDVRGDVVGFSGRVLGAAEPKYLNSPDTVAFAKSRNMFALNLAKKTKAGMLVLVEGNIDVVTLHQAGFDCAVAPLGTAFTQEQARLIAQYTERIIIAFDSDEAGRKATLRALPLLEKTGKDVKVIDLGAAGDPDDFIRKRGADAFKVLLERGESHIEYRLLTILNRYDISTDEGRISYLAAATELLAEIDNRPEREIYATRVAKTANISVEAVNNEIIRKLKIRRSKGKKEFEKNVTRAKSRTQPVSRELRYSNESSAIAEEGVIRCIVRDPTLMKITAKMGFSQDEFTSGYLAKVFDILEKRVSSDRGVSQALISSELEPGEASQLSTILQKPESLSNSEKTVSEYIEKIRSEKYKAQIPDEEMLLEIKRLKKDKTVEDK